VTLPATLLLATIFLVLLAGVTVFVRYFVVPARRLELTLISVIGKIQALALEHRWDLTTCFAEDVTLTQIWLEYRGSLHKQTAVGRSGQGPVIVAVQSTQPAEAFFSTEAAVDYRIHTEFFRHLPGLFTGVGIIGTFTGLIMGLQHFEISQNADVVRRSLGALLAGVSHAFYASAGAIVLAMIATAVEKFYVNRLYGLVRRLNRLIDSTFDAGSAESYLSRLVEIAEEMQGQSKTLKDDLLAELKTMLGGLSDRQIAASRQNLMDLGRMLTAVGEPPAAAPKPRADVFAGLRLELNEVSPDGLPELMHRLRTAAGEAQGETDARLKALGETLEEAARSFSRMGAMSHASEPAAASAARALEAVRQDHAAGLEASAQMASALADLLEMSTRGVEAMPGAPERLGAVVDRLAEAKTQADQRLASAAETLEAARREFVNSLKLTLIEANVDVNRELSSAAAVLRGAIERIASPAPPAQRRAQGR
jgi:hypothetical protein